MKYLYKLSIEELDKLIEKDLKIKGWLIHEGTPADRIAKINHKAYFTTLEKQAKKQGINAKPAEILSWLDTLNLLYYSLGDTTEEVAMNLTIIQEYQIPFTNKRADYVLVADNKILIIEFSFDKLSNEYKYETKLNQAIGYKELLMNVLPSFIEVGTYTFLISPEIDVDGNEILKWDKYEQKEGYANNEKIYELGKYISLFFKRTRDTAMNELEYIDGYVTGMNEED